MGLAIALELRLAGLTVTLLTRNFAEAAAQAAAGMLAPQAEAIPPSPLRDLCLRSRDLYPTWTQKLENLTGQAVGYWPCGILAPVYDAAPSRDEDAEWCDLATLDHQYPGLGADVVGAHWYPQDAQVDNRALAKALWLAVQDVGVEIHAGITVNQICHTGRRVTAVTTTAGTWTSDRYILATGAWSQDLLPIPVFPRKGQLLAVQSLLTDAAGGHLPNAPLPAALPLPADLPLLADLPLQTVLFGEEIYLVPRRDGRIIIGATSEDVGFTPHNTPAGMQALLTRAARLFPALQDFPIQEFWWGFRPATPDENPILGESPYENLILATGHYRNGILLTPITAQLIANLILNQSVDPGLEAFHWSRFAD